MVTKYVFLSILIHAVLGFIGGFVVYTRIDWGPEATSDLLTPINQWNLMLVYYVAIMVVIFATSRNHSTTKGRTGDTPDDARILGAQRLLFVEWLASFLFLISVVQRFDGSLHESAVLGGLSEILLFWGVWLSSYARVTYRRVVVFCWLVATMAASTVFYGTMKEIYDSRM